MQLDYYHPCVSHSVEPRKLAKPCTRMVVAVTPDYVEDENGCITTPEQYVRDCEHFAPHIVVTFGTETWLYMLHEYWRDHTQWSWRVAVTDKHGRALQVKRVAYYGFKRAHRREPNRYHVVIDAGSFLRSQDHATTDLLKLGRDVREFCNAYGLEVRASAAGIANQLLRHPMFYPFARRRVPHWINEDVRPHLPGGHYESYTDAGQRIEAATYVDQECAHHFAAESTPLPNANSVRAIGYTLSDKAYARRGTRLYTRETRKHGLVKALVTVPAKHAANRFAPRLMQFPGERVAYVWTNELPYFESLGLEVQHLIAVWGTEEIDAGLAKYAQWAQRVQRRYPALKALLLMPYGLLARRRSHVTYYHPGGSSSLILANQRLDDAKASQTIETQPDTANALQLGLIQAFVRSLSLDMARQLHARGDEVVSIYADGVFVKLAPDKSIPMFPPWRIKDGDYVLDLNDSLRVPIRGRIRRDYLAMR